MLPSALPVFQKSIIYKFPLVLGKEETSNFLFKCVFILRLSINTYEIKNFLEKYPFLQHLFLEEVTFLQHLFLEEVTFLQGKI
jgi:hypothetical protein